MKSLLLTLQLFYIVSTQAQEIVSSNKHNQVHNDSKIISNPIIQINQEIIGIWINEDDLSYKLEFLDNGVLKEYGNNQLVATLAYSISHSCETTSDPRFEFLKKIENDGSTYCYEINGINIDNSGILSIRSMENGKLYIFNRL